MIKAYGKRIIVKLLKEETITSGGIALPDSVQNDQPTKQGIVTSMGHEVPPVVFVGQSVLFGRYAGIPLGEDMLSLKEDEILGKYDNTPKKAFFDHYIVVEMSDISQLERKHFDALTMHLFKYDMPTTHHCQDIEQRYGNAPMRDSYLCFVHSDIAHFLRSIDGFIDVKDYPVTKLFPDEYGCIGNLRIIRADHPLLKLEIKDMDVGVYRILAMPALCQSDPLELLDRKGVSPNDSIIMAGMAIGFKKIS